MAARYAWQCLFALAAAGALSGVRALPAQDLGGLLTPPPRTAAPPTPAEPASGSSAAAKVSPPRDLTPAFTADARSGLRVTKGSGALPNDHGQVWREYDISPYTTRISDVERPQQAIVDWILRETGADAWFSEPLGILSASSGTLRVYHTPEMQQKVRDIVERFVASDEQAHILSVRLVTVSSPNWRAKAISLLKPIEVNSPGVEAWLLSRENAAVLYETLQARADFREHSSPRVEIFNGQAKTLARQAPVRYNRGVQPRGDGLAYELIPGQVDEGYSLEISSLMSLDGQTVDVAMKCQVDQVEKLLPVAIDVPVVGQGQRVQIQVPQVVSWRLAERFRWPADQVLLLSCGVVANPAASESPLAMFNPFGPGRSRADALLFVSHQGDASSQPTGAAPRSAATAAPITPPATPTVPTASKPTGSSSISRGRY